MSDMSEVVKLIEKQGDAWDANHKKTEARFSELEKDLNEIKEELPSDMEFILAKETDEVLRKALTKDPFVYRKPIQIQKEEIKEQYKDKDKFCDIFQRSWIMEDIPKTIRFASTGGLPKKIEFFARNNLGSIYFCFFL